MSARLQYVRMILQQYVQQYVSQSVQRSPVTVSYVQYVHTCLTIPEQPYLTSWTAKLDLPRRPHVLEAIRGPRESAVRHLLNNIELTAVQLPLDQVFLSNSLSRFCSR